jgi:hypothetical protein
MDQRLLERLHQFGKTFVNPLNVFEENRTDAAVVVELLAAIMHAYSATRRLPSQSPTGERIETDNREGLVILDLHKILDLLLRLSQAGRRFRILALLVIIERFRQIARRRALAARVVANAP